MIERDLRPGNSVMALLARLRETGLCMVRIRRAVEVFLMTSYAVRRCALEFSAEMACGTFESGVSASQREASHLQVIKARAEPGVHARMALGARGGKSRLLVIRTSGVQVVGRVAANAICGKSGELPCSNILVAGIAVGYRVRTKQRKTILMFLDRPQRHLPSIHGMTTFAIGPHLPPVNIRVAVSATESNICKHRTHVALLAHDFCVHAAQRILRLAVIELGDIANRLPSCERMAVLARDVQRTMRTMRGDGILRLLRRCAEHRENNDYSGIQNLFRRQLARPYDGLNSSP